MLEEDLISKDAISKLVRSRPPKKISFSNLVLEDMIDLETVQKFLAVKVRAGVITLEHLEKIQGINLSPILEMVAKDLRIEFVDLDACDIDMHLFNKIPYSQLLRYNAMPIEETDLNILVAFEDALDMGAQEALQRLFPKKPINIAIAKPSQIKKYLQQMEISDSVGGLVNEVRKDLSSGGMDETDPEESPAVVKLIDIILKSSIVGKASDIHIEATEKNCIVRDRVDGMLKQTFTFDKDIFPPLSSRVKLMSGLDIAEKRKPQDGRFSALVANREFDFRVSTLPTMHGESIVMRILDKSKVMIRLEDAGMSKANFEKISEGIAAPFGIVLVTGPTGSGKTTTLYGALNAIRDPRDKIITVEDPVEYQMNGIQQVMVKNAAGLTFAAALKSILRQDPDKIMIGEIRDQETLRIAIQAALTGHLVLSTLHTNDSISAVNRILDMGIESYLLSGALVAIQAQRLVRKLCYNCKIEHVPEEKMLREIREFVPEDAVFYTGEGCKECNQTGYGGREMISEVLMISEELARMIANSASKEEMTKQALKEGFSNMFEDGIRKAMTGATTVEEIYRVAKV
jgi:general secretion pathway protein E